MAHPRCNRLLLNYLQHHLDRAVTDTHDVHARSQLDRCAIVAASTPFAATIHSVDLHAAPLGTADAQGISANSLDFKAAELSAIDVIDSERNIAAYLEEILPLRSILVALYARFWHKKSTFTFIDANKNVIATYWWNRITARQRFHSRATPKSIIVYNLHCFSYNYLL